ncbi:AaceriABR192Wp [[Ashbya] aceris (nom. inval.)]|nr:AaceriABR192Wp [[Ashbya] aceris (nom. inval.)]
MACFLRTGRLRLHGGIRQRWYSACSETVLDELRARGLVQQISEPVDALVKQLRDGKRPRLYCGADPTAASLHLGNLMPLMVLLHCYVRGHDVVALVGGATGRVGDPSGRSTERAALEEATRADNVRRIGAQFKRFFENGRAYHGSRVAPAQSGRAVVVDNLDWWKDVGLLDFLARYGRHIRVQNMLGRESVSARLSGGSGMGFNEFAYQILQAYDFYHLYKHQDVTIQVGGGDQWGNITAGIDLIGRLSPGAAANPAFGVTVPLLLTASGAKFGKSAGNAVFVDPEITPSYQLYQFFVNTADADVARFLRLFTMLPLPAIDEALAAHTAAPQRRLAQHLLAREVVDLLHGVGCGNDAEAISEVLFSGSRVNLPAGELLRLFSSAGILRQAARSASLVDLMCTATGSSRADARRKLSQGAVYLGPDRSRPAQDIVDLSPYLIEDRVLLLRVGKQQCYVFHIQ